MFDATGWGRLVTRGPNRASGYEAHEWDRMGTDKRRINTQIPRRKKVAPTAPLESEWDEKQKSPPQGMRTSRDKMVIRKDPSTRTR